VLEGCGKDRPACAHIGFDLAARWCRISATDHIVLGFHAPCTIQSSKDADVSCKQASHGQLECLANLVVVNQTCWKSSYGNQLAQMKTTQSLYKASPWL
jgi:hypothetical protein